MRHVQLPVVSAGRQQQLTLGHGTVWGTGSAAPPSTPSTAAPILLAPSNTLGLYLPIHQSLTEFPFVWDVRGSHGTCPALPAGLLSELAFPYHVQQVQEAVVWFLPREAERKRTDFDQHSITLRINATTTIGMVLQEAIDALWKGYPEDTLARGPMWLLGDAAIARQRRGATSAGGRVYWRHIDLYPPTVLYFRGLRPLGRIGQREHFLAVLSPIHPGPR
ncbi:hypothetical protein C8Q78DRAFT_1082343 [Trametes maxima]|nr:hypothetical protein C8Q78DRAFT_1082343 [Trametes maxima]